MTNLGIKHNFFFKHKGKRKSFRELNFLTFLVGPCYPCDLYRAKGKPFSKHLLTELSSLNNPDFVKYHHISHNFLLQKCCLLKLGILNRSTIRKEYINDVYVSVPNCIYTRFMKDNALFIQ